MPYAVNTRHTDDWIKQVCDLNPPRMVVGQDGVESKTSFTTGPMRLMFTDQLFTAKAIKGADGQTARNEDGTERKTFGVSALFPLCADLTMMRQLWTSMTYDKWPTHWDPSQQAFVGLHSPFRSQFEYVAKQYKGVQTGGNFLSPSSSFKPKIVDVNFVEITDPAMVYSGVWAILELNAFYMGLVQTGGSAPRKKGVNFGLSSVMIIANDDTLAGGAGSDPRAAFSGVRQMAGMDVNAAIQRAPSGVMLPSGAAPLGLPPGMQPMPTQQMAPPTPPMPGGYGMPPAGGPPVLTLPPMPGQPGAYGLPQAAPMPPQFGGPAQFSPGGPALPPMPGMPNPYQR